MNNEQRYKEIKDLWAARKENHLSQWQIGEMYGITQSWISSIIHDIRPKYRCCATCKKHIPLNLCVCPECKVRNKSERAAQTAAKQEARKLKPCKKCQKMFYIRGRQVCLECGADKPRMCRRCDTLIGFRRRVCDACKPKYFLTTKCVFCGVLTGSRWKVCLQCAPYRVAVENKGYEGREGVRALARARDGHSCQSCGLRRTPDDVRFHNSKIKGLKGKIHSLDVHHLDGICGKKSVGYDKVEDLHKLITLCHKCHYARHDFSEKGKRALQGQNRKSC